MRFVAGGRRKHKVIFMRFLSMLLGVALLAGNALITPAPLLNSAAATATDDHHGAHGHGPATDAGGGDIQAPDVPAPSARFRCPRPSLDCPCEDCQDYFAAHFMTLAVLEHSLPIAYQSESPQPWFPANHVHPSDPPPVPPPNRT